jgi:4a-hydroxytetrahydrobiopterin dehydratase
LPSRRPEAQGRGTIGDDVRDATNRVPILWFQETDPHPTPRQRFHIDVQVPYDVAEQRIAAAVAAGAVIVDDSRRRRPPSSPTRTATRPV